MADIHVESELDVIDRLQVVLYRLGITLAGGALLLPAAAYVELPSAGWYPVLLLLASALMASSLHIYDKRIRWVLCNATWLALVLFPLHVLMDVRWLELPIHSLPLVTLAGIAYKESFCFRISGLKLVPYLLVAAVVADIAGIRLVQMICLGLAGLLFVRLSVAKWRMPLHYDIGDKTKYQV